jgi:hypothetical protein
MSVATVHTNTIENVFSVFKRGMHGVYQHCGEAHLHRYLAEFEFRYNRRSKLGIEDTERAADAIRGAELSASCIGGLGKPRTPRQLALKLWRMRKK